MKRIFLWVAIAALMAGCLCPQCSEKAKSAEIRKEGTYDIYITETTPVVFKGRTWILEYIRDKAGSRRYRHNQTGKSYLRFRAYDDMKTVTPAFGVDLHLASAFSENGRMYVTATTAGNFYSWQGHSVVILESDDLEHWSEPRTVVANPDYHIYNTSIARADDRYVMVFELGAPKEKVGEPFTMFFAESRDLRTWKEIDGAVFGRTHYTGSPLLRYFDGWFYFFYLGGSYADGFVMRVVRSRDLKNWTYSPKTVLGYGQEDKQIHPRADFTDAELVEIAAAKNINASDLDFTDTPDGLLITYSWGDQRGHEFIATAKAKTTQKEFCESFFE